MREIIDDINQAELQAAEIKSEAQLKAAKIAEGAEERCNEILKLSEAECKTYRENSIKAAQKEAEEKYSSEITVIRAEQSQYAAERLKQTDKAVNDIVRRILRGGC